MRGSKLRVPKIYYTKILTLRFRYRGRSYIRKRDSRSGSKCFPEEVYTCSIEDDLLKFKTHNTFLSKLLGWKEEMKVYRKRENEDLKRRTRFVN